MGPRRSPDNPPFAFREEARDNRRVTHLLEQVFSEASERWYVSRRAAIAIMAFPVVGFLLDILLANVHRPWMHWLAKENGVIEWGQFSGYALAVVFSLLVARELLRLREPLWGLLFLVLSAGCFFLAGEEIDWGQRVFDFGTPHTFAVDNRQHVTDVHNLKGASSAFIAGQAAIALYGTLVTWFVRLRWKPRSDVVDLLFPPLFLTPAFFVVLVWRALGPVVPDENIYSIVYGEWTELCVAYGLVLFAALSWRRIRLASRTPAVA